MGKSRLKGGENKAEENYSAYGEGEQKGKPGKKKDLRCRQKRKAEQGFKRLKVNQTLEIKVEGGLGLVK